VGKPTHAQIEAAITATGDPALAGLTSEPGSYVLRRLALQGETVELLTLVFVEVAHPMSVILATDRQTGRARVTSGQPDAVREVVASDPSLAAPAAVWELIRPFGTDAHLINARFGENAADGSRLRYVFDVRSRDEETVETWTLTLAAGTSTLERPG
jgi:hypothetical protein